MTTRRAPAFAVRARLSEGKDLPTKEEKIEVEGEVVEALPSTMFRVQLEGGPRRRGQVELGPNDLSRGRITYRHR